MFIDSNALPASKTDRKMETPRVYVDVDRELTGLTVRLGSKIDSATVDQIVTWLSHTGRVEKVELSQRNRIPGSGNQ